MVMADGMNEHGGRSANPPSASFYGERNMIATRYVLISPKRPFLMGRFWRKAVVRVMSGYGKSPRILLLKGAPR
jgi:hypothetical protein